MFKRSKKVGEWIVIVLMAATSLVGCGQGQETPSVITKEQQGRITTDTPQTAGEADPYAPIEGKEYKFTWVGYQMAPIDANPEILKIIEDAFDVEIDVWNIENNQWDQVLNLKFASGEIPDRIRISSLGNLAAYQKQDLLAEIPEEVIQKYAPNIYKYLQEDMPGMLEYGKIEGKIYGIPQVVDMHNLFRQPLVYRGDWMKTLGIEKTPETLEEFEDMMYQFAKNDPDQNKKNDTYGLSSTSMNAVYGAFGYLPDQWADKDGEIVYGGIQPEMKEALALLHKWYADGVIDPEFITGENTGGYWALSHKFINGTIGTSSQGNYYHWHPELRKGGEIGHNYVEIAKLNPVAADSMMYGPPPIGPQGKSGMNQGFPMTRLFNGLGVHLEDEPDKIGKFLQISDWAASDYENYLTAWFGEKGKTWEYDEAKRPIVLDPAHDSIWQSSQGGHTFNYTFQPLEFQKIMYSERFDWATKLKFDQGGMINPVVTALPSGSKYMTELDKIRGEAYVAIITGDKPIDYFEEYVAKWKSAGGDILTQEANDWYTTIK